MIVKFIIGYLTASLVSYAIMQYVAIQAPLGYEDDEGFHLGYPDKDEYK